MTKHILGNDVTVLGCWEPVIKERYQDVKTGEFFIVCYNCNEILEVEYHSLIKCSSAIILGELILQAEHLVKHW